MSSWNNKFLDPRKNIALSVDLPSYIETELGLNMQWAGNRESCKCLCPFHGDSDPSFSLRLYSDGHWGFRCFGCSVRGSVVQFFMYYYKIDFDEAISRICEYFNIDVEGSLIESVLTSNSNKTIKKGDLSSVHKIVAIKCKQLIRENPSEENINWVREIYAKLNDHIENFDCDAIYDILYVVEGLSKNNG